MHADTFMPEYSRKLWIPELASCRTYVLTLAGVMFNHMIGKYFPSRPLEINSPVT